MIQYNHLLKYRKLNCIQTRKNIIDAIANFPIFFAAIADTLLVVTKPLSSIQNPAAIKAPENPPM